MDFSSIKNLNNWIAEGREKNSENSETDLGV